MRVERLLPSRALTRHGLALPVRGVQLAEGPAGVSEHSSRAAALRSRKEKPAKGALAAECSAIESDGKFSSRRSIPWNCLYFLPSWRQQLRGDRPCIVSALVCLLQSVSPASRRPSTVSHGRGLGNTHPLCGRRRRQVELSPIYCPQQLHVEIRTVWCRPRYVVCSRSRHTISATVSDGRAAENMHSLCRDDDHKWKCGQLAM